MTFQRLTRISLTNGLGNGLTKLVSLILGEKGVYSQKAKKKRVPFMTHPAKNHICLRLGDFAALVIKDVRMIKRD